MNFIIGYEKNMIYYQKFLFFYVRNLLFLGDYLFISLNEEILKIEYLGYISKRIEYFSFIIVNFIFEIILIYYRKKDSSFQYIKERE